MRARESAGAAWLHKKWDSGEAFHSRGSTSVDSAVRSMLHRPFYRRSERPAKLFEQLGLPGIGRIPPADKTEGLPRGSDSFVRHGLPLWDPANGGADLICKRLHRPWPSMREHPAPFS